MPVVGVGYKGEQYKTENEENAADDAVEIEKVIKTLEKYYNLDEMANLLSVPKEKIGFTSKGLAKTLPRSKYFSTTFKKGPEVQRLIDQLLSEKKPSKQRVVRMYQELLEVYRAGGTHSELVFLRHARKAFVVRRNKNNSLVGFIKNFWNTLLGSRISFCLRTRHALCGGFFCAPADARVYFLNDQ